MKRPSRMVNVLNALSLTLAMLVVTGSTLYVVSEQPWFQNSSLGNVIGDMPLPGVIRCRLSHHR